MSDSFCADEGDSTPTIPTVTITDLARFAPADSTPVVVEPAGVAIMGRPANIVTTATTHTVGGTLFGFPVSVRFSPDQYRFDYGDGTVRILNEPGATWESTGDPQFTPTSTSHVYRERGNVTVRVDVLYTAEVSFGYGWTVVPGHVTSTGVGTEIRVWEARTALVAHTCHETPTAPGC